MSSRLHARSVRILAAVVGATALAFGAVSAASADPHIWMVPGGTPMKQWYPQALALDTSRVGEEQRLLVFDSRRHQLVQVKFDGTREVIAGNGRSWYSNNTSDVQNDGVPALDTRLGYVSHIRTRASAKELPGGEILVLESEDRIRSIRPYKDASDPTGKKLINVVTTVLDGKRSLDLVGGGTVKIVPMLMDLMPNGDLLVFGGDASGAPGDDGQRLDDDGARAFAKKGYQVFRVFKKGQTLMAEVLAGGGGEKPDLLARPAVDVALPGSGFLSATPEGGFLLGAHPLWGGPQDDDTPDQFLQVLPGKNGALELRVVEVRRGKSGLSCVSACPNSTALMLQRREEIQRLDSGSDAPVSVVGGDRWGYNGNARPAATARISNPTNIQFAPGGGFFFLDSQNQRLRFVGPDDDLEAALVAQVQKATKAIDDRDLDTLNSVIAELGERAGLPNWKAGHNLRLGEGQGRFRHRLVEGGFRKDLLRYIRQFAQYNDKLEWMQALRHRMALQTIHDRIQQQYNEDHAEEIAAAERIKRKEQQARYREKRARQQAARLARQEQAEVEFAQVDLFADDAFAQNPPANGAAVVQNAPVNNAPVAGAPVDGAADDGNNNNNVDADQPDDN